MIEIISDYIWLFVFLVGLYWIAERVIKGVQNSRREGIEQTNNWLREHMDDHGTGKFDAKIDVLIRTYNNHLKEYHGREGATEQST